jgi:hypothetical protein
MVGSGHASLRPITRAHSPPRVEASQGVEGGAVMVFVGAWGGSVVGGNVVPCLGAGVASEPHLKPSQHGTTKSLVWSVGFRQALLKGMHSSAAAHTAGRPDTCVHKQSAHDAVKHLSLSAVRGFFSKGAKGNAAHTPSVLGLVSSTWQLLSAQY